MNPIFETCRPRPEVLAGTLTESDTDFNLAAASDLRISYRYYGDEWGGDTVGTMALLPEQLRNYRVQSENGACIEEIVQKASTAIDPGRRGCWPDARETLRATPGSPATRLALVVLTRDRRIRDDPPPRCCR